MNPEIKTLLGNMEFHESKDKPGLWSKAIDESESGIMGVMAYVDFRRSPEKGRRFYTIEGTDGFREDADAIPTLTYFKEQRDKILGLHEPFALPEESIRAQKQHDNKTPEPKEQGTKTPPNLNKQSSVPCVPGETSSLLVPAGTIKDAVELFKVYEQAKKEILNDKDVLWIGANGAPAEKGKGQPHIKRSGWRKLARFFNLSVEPIKRERIGTGKEYTWIYTVKVSHPNGAFFVGDGAASSNDKFFTKGGKVEANEEDVMMKAETVAINRTISDMLGGGECSAEEVEK